jgi:hypothetical protein
MAAAKAFTPARVEWGHEAHRWARGGYDSGAVAR